MCDGHDFQLKKNLVVIVMTTIQPLLCDLLLALGSKTTFNRNIMLALYSARGLDLPPDAELFDNYV